MISISISTSKSGSNWLDRLRSSRGFPTGGEQDLDRFLASSSSSASPQPGPSTRSESTPSFRRGNSTGAGEVSDVLSDLFNMGESSRRFSKQQKSSRKQSNPKFFNGGAAGGPDSEKRKSGDGSNGIELCSSDDLRREKSENAVASSGDNSLNDKNANTTKNSNNEDSNNVRNNHSNSDADKVVVDDGDDDVDLKAYTRNEVTVIDTSYKEWKSDKWVFRMKENDEWKIKDKKSSYRGGRKRKADDNNPEMENNKQESDGKEKKKKKIIHLNEARVLPQNDKEKEPVKEPSQIVASKVPRNRFPCPRPPEKPRHEGSPVILLKSITPSDNTNVITKLGKGIHKKRPKKMKII